jgi:aminoglycoside phosphotransferase (APT) family kinase protein
VGRHLRRLHALSPPDPLGRFDHRRPTWSSFLIWWSDGEIDRCADAEIIEHSTLARARVWLRETFAEMSRIDRGFIHGDLQPDHVLLRASSCDPIIIDWGDAATGDPLWDLTVLTLDHPERLDLLLEDYRPSESFRIHIARYLGAYRLLRYVSNVNWLSEAGFDPSASVTAVTNITSTL